MVLFKLMALVSFLKLVQSKMSFTNISKNLPPYRYWLLALSACFAYIPCAGVLTSNTVVTHYLVNITETSNSSFATNPLLPNPETQVSFLSSTAFGLTVGMCVCSTWLAIKLNSYKTVAMIGLLGVVVSMTLTAFMPNIYWMFLTYSILFGFANNCTYNGLISFMEKSFMQTDIVKEINNYDRCQKELEESISIQELEIEDKNVCRTEKNILEEFFMFLSFFEIWYKKTLNLTSPNCTAKQEALQMEFFIRRPGCLMDF